MAHQLALLSGWLPATQHTQWPALMRTDAICQQYVYLRALYPQCPLSMQKQSSVRCRQQAYKWSVTLLQKCSPTVKDVVYWYQFSNFRVVFSSACFVKAGIYRFKTDFFHLVLVFISGTKMLYAELILQCLWHAGTAYWIFKLKLLSVNLVLFNCILLNANSFSHGNVILFVPHPACF